MIHKSNLKVSINNIKYVLIVSVLFPVIDIYYSFSLEPQEVHTIVILNFTDKSLVIPGIHGKILYSILLTLT